MWWNNGTFFKHSLNCTYNSFTYVNIKSVSQQWNEISEQIAMRINVDNYNIIVYAGRFNSLW